MVTIGTPIMAEHGFWEILGTPVYSHPSTLDGKPVYKAPAYYEGKDGTHKAVTLTLESE